MDYNLLIDFIQDETDRIIDSDQYSHQEDAYNAGVGAAIEAILLFAELQMRGN